MKTLWLIPVALPLLAAAPPQRLSMQATEPMVLGTQSAPPGVARPPAYQPAPLPNRSLDGPSPGRASSDPTWSPTLFTSRTQYRGDGFSPGSTAQSVEDDKVRPAAGFKLRMPLTPQ